jgi:signal transduction histidine kinase
MILDAEIVGGLQVVAGVLALVLLKPAIDNPDTPGSKGYALLTVGTALWMFSLGWSNFVANYTLLTFGYHFLVLGTELAAAGWLFLALFATDRTNLVRHTALVVVTGIVLLQLFLWTNPLHNFMYQSGAGVVDGMIRNKDEAIAATFGWWWIHVAASYLLVLAGETFLLWEWFRSTEIRRKQFGWLSLTFVPLFIASVVSTFGLFELPYNVSSFGFLLALPFLTVGLFRTGFLDIVPVARRTATAEMDAAMVTLDKQDRVVNANRRARELFDGEPDYVGTDAREFFTPVPAPVFSRLIDSDDADTELTVTIEGQQRHFSISTTPIGERTTRGRVVLLHDITSQKQREEELEETKQTLEKSNKKLDQFAGIVSHDLRNPLNAAQLRLDLLRREKTDEHIDEVEGSLDRMQSMIEDLLLLSRAGRSIEDPQQVSLVAVATESWEMAQTEDAELEVSVDESTTVRADRNRLRHVFENLFRNAVDHNDPPLTVRMGLLDVSDGTTDQSQRGGFFIEDNGDGIPEDEYDDIFSHGYTTSEDGTGFGLSIVEDVVEAHDWTISIVESQEGGARFEITGVEFSDHQTDSWY